MVDEKYIELSNPLTKLSLKACPLRNGSVGFPRFRPERIAHVQGLLVQPIVLSTWLAELIHALPWAAEMSPWLIRVPTLLTKSLSLAQAFPPPPLMAVSAAFSLDSNPFFWVPVSEEALTLLIRF